MALQAKSTKTEDIENVELTNDELAAVKTTAERLQNLEDDGTPDLENPDLQAGKKPASKPVTPVESVDDSPATDEAGDKPTPVKEDEKEVELPDSLYRAAIHAEWTHEEIKDFFESNPEKALKTFEKIYHSTNKLSSEFSRLGRQPAANVQPGAQPVSPIKVDREKLEAEYGKNDPLVNLVCGLSEQVTRLSSAPVQSAPVRQDVQSQPDPYLRQQIDVFFTGDSMKAYGEFYGQGKDERGLTIGQQQNRWNLLNMADEILSGAQVTGRRMDLNEAMERAHMVLTDSLRTETARKELVAKVKIRAKSLTLKPRGQSPKLGAKSNTEQDFESNTAERLANVFGKE
jgi:hypothetical protein